MTVMKNKSLLVLPLAAMLAMTGCNSTSVFRNFTFGDNGVSRPMEFPVLRATGYASISRQPGATAELRQVKAMRASKLEAYRELSEQVNGIYIDASSGLNANNVEVNSTVKTEAEGYVHGARVIRQYAMGDIYATELELDTRLVYDLYDIRGAL